MRYVGEKGTIKNVCVRLHTGLIRAAAGAFKLEQFITFPLSVFSCDMYPFYIFSRMLKQYLVDIRRE